MAKVILICGRIASGKTEYAKRLIKDIPAVLLSVDEITVVLFGPHGGKNHDLIVEKTQKYLFKKTTEIIASGINVVLDWGFWTSDDRKEAIEFFTSHDIYFEWHYIDASNEILQFNLRKRNFAIETGKVDFYYFDDALAKQLWDMFEVPNREEMDVWVTDEDITRRI